MGPVWYAGVSIGRARTSARLKHDARASIYSGMDGQRWVEQGPMLCGMARDSKESGAVI